MPAPRRFPDAPPPYGAHCADGGVQFCVYAGHAEAVALCLDTDDQERRIPMREHAHGAWSVWVDGVGSGQRYGYRVDGPWAPAEGHRYNPAKLLVDPYAYAISGEVDWRPEVFGHVVDDSLSGDGDIRDDRDSAPYVPRSVVVNTDFDWGDDHRPQHSWPDSVLYEAHVVGLTRTLPGVPDHLRGTYAGVAHPAMVAHLHRVGATAVELLPVHAFTHEPALVQRGLTNYWGYNTLGFFAPHARYASTADPQCAVEEFKGMVKILHSAGIEVILDVVYNHTGEQSAAGGATLSWRGFDNRAYYRLDQHGRDEDVTGCGNTIDVRHPIPMRMVLDSLRYWVQEMHVDGFRFDLAVALGRGKSGAYHPDNPLLMALRSDPVLSQVKLIAEPWDVGPDGWRTGQFPPPFAEWNDKYRDTVRTFWLPDVARSAAGQSGHGVRELATRLAGSADLFAASRRGPMASINLVTAHDGFTIADLTAYNDKHNEANGEDNRDGTGDNRSWNHGVEGPAEPDDPIAIMRRRTQRNLLATLLLSSGVPMIVGGDEMGRSQGGNNNPYCQDNEISWYDWSLEPWQQDLVDTTATLARFRRDHPVLRQRHFFPGEPEAGDERAALCWHRNDGALLTTEDWHSADLRTLQVVFDGQDVGDTQVLLVLHGDAAPAEIVLPKHDGVTQWQLRWSSVAERPDAVPDVTAEPGAPIAVDPASLLVFERI
ncbi:glycogen debranching protein GlgX [Demetria terragena]|uniref:glycogen debranching protein GlgX n=1 Tax=Demetria terragena TaxID=63959 RepID=UPI00058C30FB|nr:glycogen debranching protein GlgX [Demetria terragena]